MNESALPMSLGYGDYLRFSKLLQDRYGLFFSERRRSELELAVRQAFNASPCRDLNEYFNLLVEQTDGGLEMERLVNAATVNETYFFRDTAQFDALYRTVLPEIIERRRPLRTLRIWSAGCASGEEPYSLAMLLCELLPDINEWAITILGTDINTEALNRARQGLYGEWAFREVRAREWRLRYFQARGLQWELDSRIRRMVSFTQLNLADSGYPTFVTNTMYLDLILCRNVTIYFNEAFTRQVVDRFYDALVDNGWLIVGHAELSLNIYRRFAPRNYPNAVFYQRSAQFTPTPPVNPGPAVASDFNPGPVPPLPPGTAPLPEIKSPDPLEQARKLLGFGKSRETKELLAPLAKAPPVGARRAELYALLARACANLSELSEAERWCNAAIQEDRLHLEAYYTLGLVLQHQKRLEPAIEALKKVVYIDRNDVLGHFALARLYHEQGQLAPALKALDNTRRLLENQPDEVLVPRSGGITVRRLRDAVTRQQQLWSAGLARPSL